MELEFKHIQPYMLSNLKLQYFGNLIGRLGGYMEGMNHNPVRVCYNGQDNYNINAVSKDEIFLTLKDIKPILRPLSDVTKRINFNGDYLVFLEVIESDYLQDKDAEYLSYLSNYWIEKIKSKNISLFHAEMLFKWNFDVFNLIEKGLAIDYNSVVS